MIHQVSVLIKNRIFGLIKCTYLSDSPNMQPTLLLLSCYKDKEPKIEYVKYINEKISNLNSFILLYYMRFDSGILAPFTAFIAFYVAHAWILGESLEFNS